MLWLEENNDTFRTETQHLHVYCKTALGTMEKLTLSYVHIILLAITDLQC